MYYITVIFSITCLLQSIACQYPGINVGANQYGGYGYGGPYGLSPPVVEAPAYGGTGVGEVAVAGEMPVAGSTAVTGQVPVYGAVRFYGDIPANGIVSVTGSCNCKNSLVY